MARVTGVGGIFLEAQRPDLLAAWYREHLGVTPSLDSEVNFEWREKDSPETIGKTVWALVDPEGNRVVLWEPPSART